jgi:hypothetical protein
MNSGVSARQSTVDGFAAADATWLSVMLDRAQSGRTTTKAGTRVAARMTGSSPVAGTVCQ